jgi:hypothetical protein
MSAFVISASQSSFPQYFPDLHPVGTFPATAIAQMSALKNLNSVCHKLGFE